MKSSLEIQRGDLESRSSVSQTISKSIIFNRFQLFVSIRMRNSASLNCGNIDLFAMRRNRYFLKKHYFY